MSTALLQLRGKISFLADPCSQQTRTNTKWNVKFNIQERSADIDTRSYTHHFYFGSFNQGTNNQDSKKEKD
uniref:Uncharacterized protein n=1 Tax=Knipowitschia caucasica TaxID=637954 RepID=A0AAV2J861_KNICA